MMPNQISEQSRFAELPPVRSEPLLDEALAAIRALSEELENYMNVQGADHDDENAIALGQAVLRKAKMTGEKAAGKASINPMVSDHPFLPSMSYPPGEGCSHIVRDYPNSTMADPDHCRRPECEHTMTMRPNTQADRTEDNQKVTSVEAIKNDALIRRCDGCLCVTAFDFENTVEHKRDMEILGHTVHEVPKEEALKLLELGGIRCRCSKGKT